MSQEYRPSYCLVCDAPVGKCKHYNSPRWIDNLVGADPPPWPRENTLDIPLVIENDNVIPIRQRF